jgi:hypothetical protein
MKEEQEMAVHPPQVFSGITPAQYELLTEKARKNGIAMSGNSGSASKYGIELEWNYLPDAQQLTVQCLRTPVFVSAATVDGKLQALVRETLAQA